MMEENQRKEYHTADSIILPILPTRGFVVYPGQNVNFEVFRPQSLRALERAMSLGTMAFLGIQKNEMTENPEQDDLWDIVVSMKIEKVFKEQKDVRVLGLIGKRYRLLRFDTVKPYYEAEAAPIEETVYDADTEIAMCRMLKDAFRDYAQNADVVPHALYVASHLNEMGEVADVIAANLPESEFSRMELYLETDPQKRASKILARIDREKKISEMRRSLQQQVGREMRDIQKESFLREELEIIHRELGDEPGSDDTDPRISELLQNPNVPKDVVEKVKLEQKRLDNMQPMSPEYGLIEDYLERVASVPWTDKAVQNADTVSVRNVLDEAHYGMKRVKDRVVEFAAARKLKKDLPCPVLCLVGPPGIGKTSVASSIAESLNRPFVRVSLGGVRDEAEIRGHRRTYVGAMPGRIINALIQAKKANPVMLLDEIDKMASDLRGDPTAALLEVLDNSLNSAFRDTYLELPVDLSDVFFITTANTLEGIPLPLIDRMEIIEMESYSREEKLEIAVKYLLPRQRAVYGLKATQLRITRPVISRIITEYTREAGVRELERLLGALCRKASVAIVEKGETGIRVTEKNLASLMEDPPIIEDSEKREPEAGVVNGLAWTALGGEVLTIETAVLTGNGRLEMTGQMGGVMKESAQIALSVVRGYPIDGKDAEFYKEHDLHIHIPAGAVPKDGPSAGVTMATAMYSALSGRKVRSDVAMTGELSLRGRVLPIGGLKEKLLAAREKGLMEVFVPELNREDVEKLPEHVTKDMRIRYVTHIDTILENVVIGFPGRETAQA